MFHMRRSLWKNVKQNGWDMESRTVVIPERVWGRLATAADDRGVHIEDILVAAINAIIRPTDRRDVILALTNAGYTDRAVAEYTGESPSYVADVRRGAHLPANKSRETNTKVNPS